MPREPLPPSRWGVVLADSLCRFVGGMGVGLWLSTGQHWAIAMAVFLALIHPLFVKDGG